MTNERTHHETPPPSKNISAAKNLHPENKKPQDESTTNHDTISSPNSCSTCGAATPPHKVKCPTHSQSSHSVHSNADYSWSLSRVAIAVVPGTNNWHALALASAAFKQLDSADGTGESFDLVYDLEDLSKTITKNWETNLPECAKLSTDNGKQILEEAQNKQTQSDEFTAGGLDINPETLGNDPEPHIYRADGTAVTTSEQLDVLHSDIENADEEYWVIPATLYELSRDPTDKYVAKRECGTCGTSTKHAFEGFSTKEEFLSDEPAGIWTCLECSSETKATSPVGHSPSEPWNKESYIYGRTDVTSGD